MTTTKPSTINEILEIVTALPGATSGQIIDLMPHVKKQSVYAGLNNLYVRGLVTREKVGSSTQGRPAYAWSVNPDGKPPVVVRKVKPSNTLRWNSCSVSTRPPEPPADLYGELEELRRWKADAIARYPDLAVDPLVLKARNMVAEEIGSADTVMRDAVLRGERDGALPMRVALKLLEGVA